MTPTTPPHASRRRHIGPSLVAFLFSSLAAAAAGELDHNLQPAPHFRQNHAQFVLLASPTMPRNYSGRTTALNGAGKTYILQSPAWQTFAPTARDAGLKSPAAFKDVLTTESGKTLRGISQMRAPDSR